MMAAHEIGEAALARVIASMLRSQPAESVEALSFRAFFDAQQELLQRLSWAVGNRVAAGTEGHSAIAQSAVARIKEHALAAIPDDAEAIGTWFQDTGDLLTSIAEVVAYEKDAQMSADIESGLSLLLRGTLMGESAADLHRSRRLLDPQWVGVSSLSSAIDRAQIFIREMRLDSAHWTGGEVRHQGLPLAQVGFNGRLWRLTAEGQKTTHELNRDGMPLRIEAADPERDQLGIATHSIDAARRPAQLTEWRLADPSLAAHEPMEATNVAVTDEPSRVVLTVLPLQSPTVPTNADPAERDVDEQEVQRRNGRNWIIRKVQEPLDKAQYERLILQGQAGRSKAQSMQNLGTVAFWDGALAWLTNRFASGPEASESDLTQQREEGQRWIAAKLASPASEASIARWLDTAARRRTKAKQESNPYDEAFWSAAAQWVERLTPNARPSQELANGDGEERAEKVPDRVQRAARLRKLAESSAEKVEELRNSGTHFQTATARRNRIVAGQESEAEYHAIVRAKLLALADALENKCEPESLEAIDLTDHPCLPDSLQGVESRALVEDLLRLARFPQARAAASGLEKLLMLTEHSRGVGRLRALARSIMLRGERGSLHPIYGLEEVAGIELLIKAALEKATTDYEKYVVRSVRPDLVQYKRALAAGLTTEAQWMQARQDLQSLGGKPEPTEMQATNKLRMMERDVLTQDIEGFFPTPSQVIERMIEEADLHTGQRVLEPSAGNGRIAEAIRAAGIEPDVIESHYRLREILAGKGFSQVGTDFMTFVGAYDRILMNPPFERGQDMEHVRRAYRLLAPGGRLVAIMSSGTFSRTGAKEDAFRSWLDQVGGDNSALPAGSFLKSERPVGISAHLVVIDQPDDDGIVATAEVVTAIDASAAEKKETPPSIEKASDFPKAELYEPVVESVTTSTPELPIAASSVVDPQAVLSLHGLRVRPSKTQPTRPGKAPRDIWVVEGDTAPYRAILRTLGGKQFRGEITFWSDPSEELVDALPAGRPPLEERLEDRRERSALRAERLSERADKKTEEAESAARTAHRIGDNIPMGQPILVGHHSERHHRRDVARMHSSMDKAGAAYADAERLKAAASAAAFNAEEGYSLPFISHRLRESKARLAAMRREIESYLGSDASQSAHEEKRVAWLARHRLLAAEYERDLQYWTTKLAESGGLPFGPENVSVGDSVLFHGTWYPVRRASKKSITVGRWLGVASMEYRLRWADIKDHRASAAAAALVPPATTVAPSIDAKAEPTAAVIAASASVVAACPPENPACGLGLLGGSCAIPAPLVLPSGQGAPESWVSRYCLTEASQLIPSHDPVRGFSLRSDYPAEVQERRYERDKGEQMKVVQLAQNLKPEVIFNVGPGAMDGPPVVTETGVVLGGNGRTMGLQLHYHLGLTAARDYLMTHGAAFGFPRERVAQLRQPVIVRVIKTDGEKRQLQELVRVLNVPPSHALDVRSESVAEARRLTEDVLSVLATAFDGDDTLNEYLSSRASKPFTDALRRVGILTDRNASRYLTPLETYTDDGKMFVERLLTAALIPDATLLDQIGTEARQTLARGAPALLSAAAHGGADWDLRVVLRAAMADVVQMRSRGVRSVDEYLRQEGMFADSQPAVKALGMGATVLEVVQALMGKPLRFTLFARTFAGFARQNPVGQSSLFPAEVLKPAQALQRAAETVGITLGL